MAASSHRMMMGPLVAAIDQGTSSTRFLVSPARGNGSRVAAPGWKLAVMLSPPMPAVPLAFSRHRAVLLLSAPCCSSLSAGKLLHPISYRCFTVLPFSRQWSQLTMRLMRRLRAPVGSGLLTNGRRGRGRGAPFHSIAAHGFIQCISNDKSIEH